MTTKIDLEKLHAALVERTCKPGEQLLDRTAFQQHMVHMCLGIIGEVGELVDAIKKHVIYNKGLDRPNVVEELGDIEWYLQGLRQGLGITREEVLEHNIDKLNLRYPDKYNDACAQARADKA